MADVVNVYEAKTHLSSLIDRAYNGETIILAKKNKPMAKIVSLDKDNIDKNNGFVGFLEGCFEIPEDFDRIDLTEMFFGEDA